MSANVNCTIISTLNQFVVVNKKIAKFDFWFVSWTQYTTISLASIERLLISKVISFVVLLLQQFPSIFPAFHSFFFFLIATEKCFMLSFICDSAKFPAGIFVYDDLLSLPVYNKSTVVFGCIFIIKSTLKLSRKSGERKSKKKSTLLATQKPDFRFSEQTFCLKTQPTFIYWQS